MYVRLSTSDAQDSAVAWYVAASLVAPLASAIAAAQSSPAISDAMVAGE